MFKFGLKSNRTPPQAMQIMDELVSGELIWNIHFILWYSQPVMQESAIQHFHGVSFNFFGPSASIH